MRVAPSGVSATQERFTIARGIWIPGLALDPRSLARLSELWPDVARVFSEIVPAGCRLIRTADAWQGGERAARRRGVAFAREPGSPRLEELIDEAIADAIREGWTSLAESADDPPVFELEDVLLRIEPVTVALRGDPRRALHVAFDQPWPFDAGPPIETSDMFQNLVRNLLHIGEDPVALAREITSLPESPQIPDTVLEAVEMPCEESLLERFDALGFAPPDEEGAPWHARSESATHDIEARVLRTRTWVRVELRQSRR